MLDLEITLRRSGACPFRSPVGSAADAHNLIFRYLAYCWGIPVSSDISADAIDRHLTIEGEYRCDHEHFLIVVKPGAKEAP